VAQELGIPQQTVSRYTKKAVREGLLVLKLNSRPRFYALTPEGKKFVSKHSDYEKQQRRRILSPGKNKGLSLRIKGGSSLLSLHHLACKLPRLGGKISDFERKAFKKRFHHWTTKYAYRDDTFPPEIRTIRFTTKNVIVYFEEKIFERNPSFAKDYVSWFFKSVAATKRFLQKKYGLLTGEPQIISQHIENKMPEYDKVCDPSLNIRVKLGRPAVSATGVLKDKKGLDVEAYAEIHRSKRRSPDRILDLETNDMRYEEKLINMPTYVADLHQLTPELLGYSEQISKHLLAIEGINRGVSKWNALLEQLARVLTPAYAGVN
jgi:DNA-binding MarR family transcriptional regulator